MSLLPADLKGVKKKKRKKKNNNRSQWPTEMTSSSQMGVFGLGEEHQATLIPSGAKSDPHHYISVKRDHMTVSCNLLVDFCKMVVHSFGLQPRSCDPACHWSAVGALMLRSL